MPSPRRSTLAIALVLGAALLWSTALSCPAALAATAAPGRGDARWVVVSAPGLALPKAVAGTPWVGSAFSTTARRSALGLMPSHAAQVLVSRLATKGSGVQAMPADDTTEAARIAGAMATSTAGGSVALVQTLPLSGPTAAKGAAQLETLIGVLDLSPGVSVMVVAPPGPGEAPALTPVIVSEPRTRLSGLLASTGTKRGEVVSEADLTELLATARLARDGIGLAPGVADGTAALARVLVTRRVVSTVDRLRWPIASTYIVVFLLLLGAGVLVARRSAPDDESRRIAAAALTAPLVVPLAGYLAAATVTRPQDAVGVLLPFLVWTVVLVVAVVASAWRWGSRWAGSAALFITSLVIVADQVFGAPLLFANVFGYSLADGGRFYGIGNEGAALLLGTMAAAIALVAPPASNQRDAWWRISSAVALGIGLLVCVAPWWGANIGVAVWGSVLVIGVWAGVWSERPDPRIVGLAAAAVAAVVVLFAVIDYFLRLTHVGEALRAFVARPDSILAVMTERGGTAVRTLTGNGWTIVLLALLAALVWVRVKPSIGVWRAFADRPAVRSLVTASIAATLLALVIEDTGGSVGAYLVPLALTAVLLGVLEPDERGRRRERGRVPR